MKYYKAFNHDMTCKGKQYEENTVYEENGNKICDKWVMHFCENPFDTLDYYPLVNEKGEIGEWTEVEPMDEVLNDGNKSASKKIKIGAKLGLSGFIKACIDFTYEKTIKDMPSSNIDSGDYAQIGSSGDYAQIGSSGDSAKIGSSGDYAKIGSSGDSAKIGSSGDYAQIGSSGDSAKIGSSGDYAKIGSSGDSAKITSEGKYSVVMAAGYNSIAKAKVGSWITLAEWLNTGKVDKKGNCIWIPKCVKTEYVDGEQIKEDTFYKLVNGEFTEVEVY